MKNIAIIEKYEGKKLGAAAYKDGAMYLAHELANTDELYLIMHEIWTHEGYLTKDGLAFLSELYGLEKLAEVFSTKGGFDEAKDKVSILQWLNSLKDESVD